ncbi:MAG TPA: hypothetical protein VG759_15660 [Candidatus Angelobacter sp.]|nr:hypothetical protein [Candidatus Angelobacter sp.]
MKSSLRPFGLFVLFVLCSSIWSVPQSNSFASPPKDGAVRSTSTPPAPPPITQVAIPGPLRSFLRMAGISQKASAEETLPLLANEVNLRGYFHGRPTEFLILLMRYLQQARELANLAGPQRVITVKNCEEAKPLLDILGYRLRHPCGPETTVLTAESERAFLTIDSGFPLSDLEEALRAGKTFTLPFESAQVPLLFTPGDWAPGNNTSQDVVDSLLHNPSLARLYGALAHVDPETAIFLRQSPGLRKLAPYAPVFDFYGSHIYIRSGRVVVPGGSAAEPVWKDLVGASPDSPAEFVTKLLAKDEGWLAAFFDALSRVNSTQQAYFTQPNRLKHFYEALKGKSVTPGPARPVYRANPGLAILTTRLELESNGQPHIPGDLEIWKTYFRNSAETKQGRDWARKSGNWTGPDQLVEGLMAFSREPTEYGPLQVYFMLSEIERRRPPEHRLDRETVRLMVNKFSHFGDQYPVFSEFYNLDDASITGFIKAAESLDNIPAPVLKANAIGTFQASVGLWQILARQGQIPEAKLNDSWQQVVGPFAHITTANQLFDAGRNSLAKLLQAAGGDPAISQDEVADLLAGPNVSDPEGQQVRQQLAERIRAVLEAQRLLSLDTMFALADGLDQLAQGKPVADKILPLAGQLKEFEMPRSMFTASERIQFEHDPSDIRHATLQTRVNLTKMIKSGTPKELAGAKGQLAPFLRDTLVGLNYAYYAPPGAQMLLNNAVFVRSHDYTGGFGTSGSMPWKIPSLMDRGFVGGRGTHLAGSLADLPYILALVEQDFIVPENVQSLIWQDFVPTLLADAVVHRWWGVTKNELHAVALYQRTGEEILAAAQKDDDVRGKAVEILAQRILPQRLNRIERSLAAGEFDRIRPQMTPADTFYLAVEYREKFPQQAGHWGAASTELEEILKQHPEETKWQKLSRDFGVPHPGLAHSYARELINVNLFHSFQGYSSRLLAESWDSNNLYWARLADEMGYDPVTLNRLVPELTRRMIEKVAATNLEDWPAIFRAMQETGQEFRAGKIGAAPKQRAGGAL